MSPGVATPCPAAPPIPIAKVCFIASSLTECRPLHCSPAHGRAQIKVRIPVSETPPVKNQLVFRVAGSIHPNFRRLSPARDLTRPLKLGSAPAEGSRRRRNRNDPSFQFDPAKLSGPCQFGSCFCWPARCTLFPMKNKSQHKL